MIEIMNDRTPIEEQGDYLLELTGHIRDTKNRVREMEYMHEELLRQYNICLAEAAFDFTGFNVPLRGEERI